jgi:hypothetical protein
MVVKKLLISGFLAGCVLSMATPAIADGPSYAETLSFLQNKFRGMFADRAHCLMYYKGISLTDANGNTDRRDLFDPSTLQTTPANITNDTVTFTCLNGSSCVYFDNQPLSFVTFDVKSESMAQTVKAMGHLIELCQMRPDRGDREQLFK